MVKILNTEDREILRDILIAVDSGHGGSDPGAVAITGQKESNTNFNVSTYLFGFLKTAGYRVLLTNPSNKKLTLGFRGDLVNSSKAHLGVSIHHNAGGGVGCEVIYQVKPSVTVKSKLLATCIFDEIGKRSKKRKIYTKTSDKTGRDYFAMNAIPNCPFVIVESFFMDSSDIKLIDTHELQRAEAYRIFKGIDTYVKEVYAPK